MKLKSSFNWSLKNLESISQVGVEFLHIFGWDIEEFDS